MNPLGTLKLVERSSPGDWIPSLLSDCHFFSYSHLPLLLAPLSLCGKRQCCCKLLNYTDGIPPYEGGTPYVGPFGEGEKQYIIETRSIITSLYKIENLKALKRS